MYTLKFLTWETSNLNSRPYTILNTVKVMSRMLYGFSKKEEVFGQKHRDEKQSCRSTIRILTVSGVHGKTQKDGWKSGAGGVDQPLKALKPKRSSQAGVSQNCPSIAAPLLPHPKLYAVEIQLPFGTEYYICPFFTAFLSWLYHRVDFFRNGSDNTHIPWKKKKIDTRLTMSASCFCTGEQLGYK